MNQQQPDTLSNKMNVVAAETLLLPDSAEQWLQQLQQPTAIEVTGRDTGRWRVVSVLIHGNEPSGFIAAYRFLQHKIVPETNLAILISSIRAAAEHPVFSHRHMPGEFDLNRRFSAQYADDTDSVTQLARHITEYIHSLNPCFIVDLHNTSGNGPSFAVTLSDDLAARNLASLFTQQIVVTQLNVSSLMEHDFGCPIITVECGYAKSQSAHTVAYDGLCAFSQMHTLKHSDERGRMETFYHPIRVKFRTGVSFEYGVQDNEHLDLVLWQNIEHLNFDEVATGTEIGWTSKEISQLFTAVDEEGQDVIADLIEVKHQRIVVKQPTRFFMATNVKEIAVEDCIFYIVAV